MMQLFPSRARTAAAWRFLRIALVAVLIAVSSGAEVHPTQAQTFDSGSNGSDGELILTTPGEIIFDPRTFNPQLDQDSDNVYHFTRITIGQGVTVTLSAAYINGPVYWLSSEPVQIDGVINLNGEDGPDATNSINRSHAIAGAGGYGGGVGGFQKSQPGCNVCSQPIPPQRGIGPGGGNIPSSQNFGGGSASHAVVVSGGGQVYGNEFHLPLLGGSGGGGMHYYATYGYAQGAGGGAGERS